ncbi:hypothetical protein GJ744_001220 [Endocarpon pusillum]|uniref:Protein kinase domain-containing protein n=1 Tax=Endocarpon pusillum TaxID=364733 RepID=A0A8H7ABW7_9EURO|nr:hypothetical protein GJ744_001220 [Endocarpon pusillum]
MSGTRFQACCPRIPRRRSSPSAEPWPPRSPDITISQSVELCEAQPLTTSINGDLYRCRQGQKVIKYRASDREFRLMKKAGPCSVRPIGRVVTKDKQSGNVSVTGIIMDLALPFDYAVISPQQRDGLAREMINLTQKLHNAQYVIHGDIKPENMLIRRSDFRLVFCDFAQSMIRDEDPNLWEGATTTTNYLAPNRDPKKAPTFVDDLYALGLSIWQLYSGRKPFASVEQDQILELLKQKWTVDLKVITDAPIREIVARYLSMGGATLEKGYP